MNTAFQYAKDNIARCMRYYTLGWGMSNAPHAYTIVVGRDTGWMTVGADYVAPWFAPAALQVFRDRQKPNGQIVEYVDMESGGVNDYGLNVADNTPLYIWGIYHHWQHHNDEAFRQDFMPSVRAAADYLHGAIGEDGLLHTVPAGLAMQGISSWRNIIPGGVIAGAVTEINALTAMALRLAAELTGEPGYAAAAEHIAEAINEKLWTGAHYRLTESDDQLTGDNLFPLLCGVAPPDRACQVLERLARPDFWSACGMRTVPSSNPAYDPAAAFGLLGGSWPNLTLWYAATVAPHDPDRALAALEMVARPVVEAVDAALNINQAEFAEYFHGETGVNLGMRLSPWVAPTFIWAVMEGLLGLTWRQGTAHFNPCWPDGWEKISIRNLPGGAGALEVELRHE
ncbi:MAG: hypothetical protein JXB47_04470 [Anaerolineae bacterium]|nr:hypothetical protein [Anaerolineae bacterium]